MGCKIKDAQSPEPSPDTVKTPVLAWFTRVRHSRKGRVVFTILAIIVVGISAYYVGANLLVGLREVKQANLTLKIWPLVSSLIITWFCVVFGGVTWYLVLLSLGAQVSLRGCIQAHVLANVAGYIPGYGWRYMGKVYLTSRQDESTTVTSIAAVTEFVGLAVSRLAVALFTMTSDFWHSLFGNDPGAWLWILRIAILIVMFVLPWLLSVVGRQKRWRFNAINLRAHVPALWMVEAIMCLEWVLFGIGFGIMINAVTVYPPGMFAEAIFATTSSYLISLLAFFVPGGIGVRESVMIFTLTSVKPTAITALCAVLYRIVIIVAELLGVLVGIGLRKRGHDPVQVE